MSITQRYNQRWEKIKKRTHENIELFQLLECDRVLGPLLFNKKVSKACEREKELPNLNEYGMSNRELALGPTDGVNKVLCCRGRWPTSNNTITIPSIQSSSSLAKT